MEKLKNHLKSLSYFYGGLLIYLIIITIFNHFNWFSQQAVSIISFVVVIFLFMFLGFYTARKSEKKGYINGLIIGGVNIVMFLLLTLIFGEKIKLTTSIYFVILLLSSTVGGMFGINYRKEK